MKKLTSAALLSLALLLSACGKPGESTPADTSAEATDSTAISSDSGTEESSVEEETSAQKVKNLFTTLATTNNGTYVSAGYFTEYHYEGGMFHLLDSSVRTSYWGYGEARGVFLGRRGSCGCRLRWCRRSTSNGRRWRPRPSRRRSIPSAGHAIHRRAAGRRRC